jgi:hypothetical protein
MCAGGASTLTRFAVQGVLPATRAILIQLNPVRIIAPILLGNVIPFFTINAGKYDVASNRFFCHCTLSKQDEAPDGSRRSPCCKSNIINQEYR